MSPMRLQANQVAMNTTPNAVGNNKVIYVLNADGTNNAIITVTNNANGVIGTVTILSKTALVIDKAMTDRIQIDANGANVFATAVIWRG